MNLAGKWKKASTAECAEKYPDEIEFFDRPRYLAKRGPSQKFIWWDAGSYELIGDNQIRISVATDARELYRFSAAGDLLTFVDETGCEFQYERMKAS